mmetsp:Transcript_19023/g.28719  ORF Transcript_19023/g.28719 Transcript_19023/m.28719 type:complete len:87 (+) Transcript_19023:179-439(+)
MGHRSNYASMKDAQIRQELEESVQSSDCATAMDARTLSSKEECASGMGQRGKCVTVKDALIMLSKEESAEGTGQSSNYAAVKDAQI